MKMYLALSISYACTSFTLLDSYKMKTPLHFYIHTSKDLLFMKWSSQRKYNRFVRTNPTLANLPPVSVQIKAGLEISLASLHFSIQYKTQS